MTNPAHTAALSFISSRSDVNAVVVDAGHAHTKARHTTTCKLTGLTIHSGEALRHLEVVTPTCAWKGFTSNKAYGLLSTGSVSMNGGTEFGIRVSRCSGDWVDQLIAAASEEGAKKIQIIDKDGRESGWYMDKIGRWSRKGSYSTSTIGRIKATLKRSKNARLWRVS